MKPVIKVDFKTEDLMVKDNQSYIEFFQLDGKEISWGYVDRGKVGETNIKVLNYVIYEMYTGNGRLNYAVQNDELFKHLFHLGKDRLEEIIRQSREMGRSDGYSKGYKEGYFKGEEKCVELIRNLPWWKRLLGRF